MKLSGLSDQEVSASQLKHGKNLLSEEKRFNTFTIFLSQFRSPLIYLLFIAIIVSFLFNEHLDAYLISAVIALNVIMGFFQEYGAQKTLSALRKIIKPEAMVMRNGVRTSIETSELVPGDIVLLDAGGNVPADGKLLQSTDILVSEAILTGEEEPIEKKVGTKSAYLFMGTTVVGGRGLMQVEKIGTQTEIGKIGKSLSEIKDAPTPLQKKLAVFSRTLVMVIVFIAVLIFLVGIYYDQKLFDMFRYSVILAVAAIPEGLPVAVTVILSLGMRRILKKKGLVKRLLSIETLGATTVICTDKTGTLTKGEMTVIKDNFKDKTLAHTGLIALNNQKNGIEVAIWDYLKKTVTSDPEKIKDAYQFLHEESFESSKKHAMAVIDDGKRRLSFAIGAPEVVTDFCTLSKTEKEKVHEEFESWTKSGLRVVGLCYKKSGNLESKSSFEWLGLIGIEDPVRPSVAESIMKSKEAGIDVKIVTGDYFQTALRVAKEVGLEVSEENIMEGSTLEKISASELKAKIKNLTLFARVSPLQKLKIVEALQANGEVVAMTGDGVNDAPALKKADIGIAVGSATDVAKEAADLILLDNNFGTIVSAIEEGRIIFANIKKVVAYVLSNSFAEIVLIMGAIILKAPLPLTIVQILFVHLICDGPPDIVLGFEPKESGIMKEKPRKLAENNILELSMMVLIILISLTAGIAALVAFVSFLNGGEPILARTVAFAVIGAIDLTYIFAYKDLNQPIFKMKNFFENKYLLAAVFYGLVLLLLGIYHPWFNSVLGTTPLSLTHWLPIVGASLVTIFWVEIVKYFSQARNQPK